MYQSKLLCAGAFLFSGLQAVNAVTPEGFTPQVSTTLDLTFLNGNNIAPAGELVPRPDTASPPRIKVESSMMSAQEKGLLFMIDLDVPRQNNRVTLLHWFVPGVSVANGNIEVPENVGATYLQPSPPAGDIPHRYLFLLYKEPNGFAVPARFAINPPANTSARIGFDVQSFASAANLGEPLAANFITVQGVSSNVASGNVGAAASPSPSPSPLALFTGAATSLAVPSSLAVLGLLSLSAFFL